MTIVDYIIGGIVIMLVGIVLNTLRSKVNSKMSKPLCDERHGHIAEDLKKGDAKFETIMETQTEIVRTLGRIEGRLNDK